MSECISGSKDLSLRDIKKEEEEDEEKEDEEVEEESTQKFETFQECLDSITAKIKSTAQSMKAKKIIYGRVGGAIIREELKMREADFDRLSQKNNNLGDKFNFIVEGKLRNKIQNYRNEIKQEAKKQQELSNIFKHRKKYIDNAELKHTLIVKRVKENIRRKDEELQKLNAIIKQETERLNKPTPHSRKRASSPSSTSKSLLTKPIKMEKDAEAKTEQCNHQAYTTRINTKYQNNPRTSTFSNNNNNNNNNNNQKGKFNRWNLANFSRPNNNNNKRKFGQFNTKYTKNNNNNNNNRTNRYWNNNRSTNNYYKPYQKNTWKIPKKVKEIPIEESMLIQAKIEAKNQYKVRNTQKKFETKKELDQLRLQYMKQEKSLSECRRELFKERRQRKEKNDDDATSKQNATDGVVDDDGCVESKKMKVQENFEF